MPSTVNLLRTVWTKRIRAEYLQGVLPYERTLQASIFNHMRARPARYQVFADVVGFLNEGNPDLVITNGKHVDAVIELKFSTKAIKYEPDMDKLLRWAKRASKGPQRAYLKLNPRTITLSQEEADIFRVTDKTHWIFAAIGPNGDIDALCPDVIRKYLYKRCRTQFRHFWLFAGIVGGGERKATFECVGL